MRPRLVSLTATLLFAGGAMVLSACSSTEGKSAGSESPEMNNKGTTAPQGRTAATDVDTTTRAESSEQRADAYFAGGCFWGVEHYMEQLDGVFEVESGYMGGHVDNPTYAQVSSRTSGHYETVRVSYDPARIAYHAIAKRFFEIHDPTQKDGQGPDIGPEYESAVFFNSPAEKADAEALITELRKRGYEVATVLKPAKTFYRAEDHHQDYYERAGKEPYCHARVKRFDD